MMQLPLPHLAPFDNLPAGKRYGVIYADPPWKFATRSAKGAKRSPDRHYHCMTLEQIKALPVARLAADDCVLLMWVIDPLLEKSFEVIRAWGFTYKTVGFHWTKQNADGSDFMGSGYWTRANPEQCLLATRGRPKRLNADVRRLIRSLRREHSRKPDELYGRIQRLVAGPYLELFCRTGAPEWDAWGDEVGKFQAAA